MNKKINYRINRDRQSQSTELIEFHCYGCERMLPIRELKANNRCYSCAGPSLRTLETKEGAEDAETD